MGIENQEIIAKLLPHLDAANSLFIDQQLESLEAVAYDVLYQDLNMRTLLPLKTDINPGAETFGFRLLSAFGRADWISNYADDLPEVALRGEKRTGTIEGIGNAYSYSTQDLRAAAMNNVSLDPELARAAMRVHEEKIDTVAALGDNNLGFVGFFNHPDVTVLTATADWDTATGLQMLSDLRRLESRINEQTKGRFNPTTLVLPMNKYNQISDTPVNTFQTQTVREVFMAGAKFIREIVTNDRLLTASSTGAERAVAYAKDPQVVQLAIPLEPVQGEPEKRGLRWVRAIESRYGGIIMKYPVACVYLDGL